LYREWNHLDEAYEHVLTGIEYRQQLGGYLVVGDIPLMRILQAQGDMEGAMEVLRNAEKLMQTYHFQLATNIEFKTARIVLLLAVGDVEMASQWAKACDGGSELEQIALARLRLARGDAAGAQRLLAQQRVRAEAGGRNGRLIEILGLQAIALKAQGQTNEAAAPLSLALSLARLEGYKRLFLDMGNPLLELLEQSTMRAAAAKSTYSADDYVHDLLGAFQQEKEVQRGRAMKAASLAQLGGALVDPLTNREQEILQLLAEGLSNKEIADRLIVAPSTVKQHLKNIYSKLDVHSRTQAVTRGQELNLI
jgi:LuxR family maltose regulon positive regulatory protein